MICEEGAHFSTTPRDSIHRAVARGVPPPVLHPRAGPTGRPGAVPEVYNHRRPHTGYRTQGRPPAELFWGVTGRRDHDGTPNPGCVHTLPILDTLQMRGVR